MKLYRVFVEYPTPCYELYAFFDEEAGVEYVKTHFDEPEEIDSLPEESMHFTPYFNECRGMYGVRKGVYGEWSNKDFWEDGYAKMAV